MGFFRGFSNVLGAAVYLLQRPKLWRYLLAPFVTAVGVAMLLSWWIGNHIDPWIGSLSQHLPSFLGSALHGILWVAIIALGYLLFVVSVSILTTPFCEILSAEVEEEITGQEEERFSVMTLLRDLVLGVVHSFRRIVLLLLSVLLALVLSTFVPVIGTIVALLVGTWFTARFAAYDCFDTIWARKGVSYPDKTAYLKKHAGYSMGLGMAVAVLALIPIVNTMALPLGTVAATKAYLNRPE